ncbi:hypothetical protein [Kordiimonas sp.]|uniref:hypothetical protein n=1 Tax=Kordiimonas sp. TaxID=1970157 RepID=UPI003B51FAEE
MSSEKKSGNTGGFAKREHLVEAAPTKHLTTHGKSNDVRQSTSRTASVPTQHLKTKKGK